MATGGGSRRDGDYSKTLKEASSFMDRREPAKSTSPRSGDVPMDDINIDPGEILQKDMHNMSINKDPQQQDPDDIDDEVRIPSSVTTSSESLINAPHISRSDTNDKRKAIRADKNQVDTPMTSTPKGSSKNPRNKTTKVKSITSTVIRRSDKPSVSPRIDSFLINPTRPKKAAETPVPTVPDILDWYDAVDLPKKVKNTIKPMTTDLEPLPQREDSKCTKRLRVANDGTGLVTASTSNNVTIRHSDDVIYVNIPSATTTEEEPTADNPAIPARISWLLDNYPSDTPLPENLIGKKVRFQPEPDNTKYHHPPNPAVTNSTSDSLQAGGNDPIDITDEALPFFKHARGCLSAASRADARATHIDELVSRGLPTPWALRLEPVPAYVMPVAHELTDRQRLNALKLMSEAAASLRKTCATLVRQGNNNWNIVSKCIGDNDTELNQARLRMDSLVARDFQREKEKLDARNANIIAHPVDNKTIVENLRVRGYNNPNRRPRARSPPKRDNQADRAQDNDPPQQGNNMGARPKDPPANNQAQRGRGKRRRSNSRSRSRSPSRGRGRFGPANRGRGRGSTAYSDYRRPAQNKTDMMDPDAMAAIVRKVCQEMTQPNQNQRGSRELNYRY